MTRLILAAILACLLSDQCAAFVHGGGAAAGLVPVVNVTTGSFTASISGQAMTTSGLTGTLAANQLLYVSGTEVARVLYGSGAAWLVSASLTEGSQTMATQTPIFASSTSPTGTGSPQAQSGQAVGTLTATNSPTSWAITSCSGPGAINCASYFSLSSAGALTVNSTGAADIVPSRQGALYTLTVNASNGAGASANQAVPVMFFDDGALSAEACTVQHPTFFSGYAVRPPWQVAGVDYCVGLPSAYAGSLKDPTTATLPSGCTYNSGTHYVTCTTASVTVSEFDFSLHNGIGLVLEGASISVTYNNFVGGTNAVVPIIVEASSPYIAYNNLDEAGVADSSTFGGVIYVNSGSASGMTIEYNYLSNAYADFVDSETGTTVNRYNLAVDDGLVTGTHPDFNQFNPTSNDTTQQAYYDTWINVIPPVVVGSQGTTIGDNSDPVVGLNYFDNNTLAATGSTGPAISYWYRIVLAGLQSGATVSVQGNYADVSNAYGFDYGGDTSASVTFLNNFDMVNHVLFIQ